MKQVLHLVRRGATLPSPLVGAGDWVVDLGGEAPVLRPHGAPPRAPGPLGFDELHQLIGRAGLIATW